VLGGGTATARLAPGGALRHGVGWRLANRIDLARITDSTDVTAWLAHISDKPWGDRAVAGLVRAFADTLGPVLAPPPRAAAMTRPTAVR